MLFPDPVAFPRRYPESADREVVAFVAASFAFGAAPQITVFLDRLLPLLTSSPAAFLVGGAPLPRQELSLLRYRFISSAGVFRFVETLREVLRERGSLEAAFPEGGETGARASLRDRLAAFHGIFRARWGEVLPRERDFLFPDPANGSACKRANLFLRWVVRQEDGVDLGLWRVLTPADLIVPLDTHLSRIGTMLGLLPKEASSWKAAEALTAGFRVACPNDPVRYDFPLARLGISGACTRRHGGFCPACPLRGACAVPPEPSGVRGG